jgi:uncharacterized protein (TIGR02145 family)
MNTTKILSGCILITASVIISSCSGGARDRDGNSYKIVKIGKQEWMAENLKVSHFRNGDIIPEARSSDEWLKLTEAGKPAWCAMQNDPENDKKYGKLYNWFAVNDPRGLAPKGFHVASDDEWKQLTNSLGGGMIAALKMRTSGFADNVNETNRSSFEGLPGGIRTNDGTFYGLNSYGYWWSATEFNASNAWIRLLNYVLCDIKSPVYNKSFGLSVRCIRD